MALEMVMTLAMVMVDVASIVSDSENNGVNDSFSG